MSLEVGSLVWIRNNQPNSTITWVPGTIKAIEPLNTAYNTVKVLTENQHLFAVKFPSSETESDLLKPRNSAYTDKEDLIDLPFLNEPEILLNLKHRFEASKVFTKAGPILLTINPFDEVIPTQSCIDVVRNFIDDIRRQSSNSSIETGGKKTNHSILISGESGSGKTESFKLLVNLLGKQNIRNLNKSPQGRKEGTTNEGDKAAWFAKSLLTHKVLESFGNAMTMHTANSSRFGKVVELNMAPTGEMLGMTIRTYLLESSRTTNQQLQERNFNIFYQVLAGATTEERKRWKITSALDFHYTNQGGDLSGPWEQIDSTNYVQLKSDLLKIGIEKRQLLELLDAIIGILHLGNVLFEDAGDVSGGARIASQHHQGIGNDPLINAALFLGIQPDQLQDLMTYKSFTSRGEKIIRPLNTTQAKVARDAITKAIYRALFDWLVNTLNAKLLDATPEELSTCSSLVLVDIFGFDSFQYNSMDQLCINYANEVLQQLFNFNVFKREITLYEQEQIQYDDVIKFTDNKENIDLIAGDIFRILDDQCRLPEPNDKRFVAQLYKDLNNKKLFSANPAQQLESKFTIKHFSGPVEYTADNFILKNSDNLPTDTGKILVSSRNSVLASCVQGDQQTAAPIQFSEAKITEQLRYGGVLEAIKITRTKFRAHITYVDFYNRYRSIVDDLKLASFKGPKTLPISTPLSESIPLAKQLIEIIATATSEKNLSNPPSPTKASANAENGFGKENRLSRAVSMREVKAILTSPTKGGKRLKAIDAAKIQLGTSLVFLKVREYELLEAMRNAAIVVHVIVIQTILRRAYWLRRYRKMKTSITLLQRIYRGFSARLYCWRRRLLNKAVTSLQRHFRKKRFIRKAFKIQLFYRFYRAQRLLRRLKQQRNKLLTIYGPLVLARDMRIKRRSSFTGLPNHSDVGYILPLEKRYSHYSKEETDLVKAVMTLVSNAKLNDDQLQGELEFDKLVREISLQISYLPNDAYKSRSVANLKEIKLAEHMLKLRKLTDNTIIGKFGGSAMWQRLTNYSGDIPKVGLTPQHGVFSKINSCMATLSQLRTEGNHECETLERMRQNVRIKGVSGSDQGNADLAIATYTTQIKCVRKLMSLYEIAEKYYKHFIATFIREYGDDSPFHESFHTEKRYLKGLIEVVRAAKKYVPIPLSQQIGNGPTKQNVYRVGNCPLKVDWREHIEPPKIDLTEYSKNHEYESDLLKIVMSLELKKREFNADNLRILEFDSVGYQYQPAYPAISFAINSFTALLGGSCLPARRIVKLAGTRQLAGKVTYYQAMHGLSRSSMMDVLYNPLHIEQIDSYSFSLTVISCLVLGIFNLQPNHILVNYEYPGTPAQSIRLSSLNPDGVLAALFVDYNNPSRYRIHQRNINVLFFLPQMDEPVDADVRAFLTSSPFIVEEVITAWLRDLSDQNRRFAGLKSAGLTPEDFNNLHVPLMLPACCSVEMRKRLNRISRLLRYGNAEREGGIATNYITLSKLLETLFPPIGDYYREFRHSSDFTQHLEEKEDNGVVSYAYMYHQALDSERRVGVQKKGSVFGNSSELAVTSAATVADKIRKSFAKKKKQERESERLRDEDDDSDIDLSSEFSSVESGSSRGSINRAPSAAFGYDQIYLESQLHEKIPGAEEDEHEQLGMISTDAHDVNDGPLEPIARVNTAFSEYDAPIDSQRLYKITGPGGQSAFEFDQVYEHQKKSLGSKSHSGGFSQSLDFVQDTPFQMIQKKVVMRPVSSKVDNGASFDYHEVFNSYSAQQKEEKKKSVVNSSNNSNTSNNSNGGAPIPPPISTAYTATATPPRAGAGIAGLIGSVSPAKKALHSNPTTPSADDNSSYLAYQKNEGDGNHSLNPYKSSNQITYEAPPEEFKRIPKRTMSKFDPDFLGEEARMTPMNRTIEEEGFEFFNSLDWRDFAQTRPFGQAEDFCEMVGRNLSFLSTIWLNHINDWQFKALFRYWVKTHRNRSLQIPGLKAMTREVILRYSCIEDMEKMKSCSGLSKLLKKFNIDLKFAVLSEPDSASLSKSLSFSQDMIEDNQTKVMKRKKSMKPMASATDHFDIYTFVPEDEGTSRESGSFDEADFEKSNLTPEQELVERRLPDFEKSNLTPEQELVERRLRHDLWACLNRIKTSELEHMDDDIKNVLAIIRVLAKDDQSVPISAVYLQSFTRLLVEYPILTPIAVMIAERKGFVTDLTVLHHFLSSRYVNKYIDIILSILYNHPEVLLKADPEGLLPCDRIKLIKRHRNLKYTLLMKFVNFAPGPFTRSFQAINKGIFSNYRGEEELIVWAAHFDLLATETELKVKKYDLWKKDQATQSITILWKLILAERDALKNSPDKENAWKVYQLLLKALSQRMARNEMSSKDIEDYIWKNVDISALPQVYVIQRRVSMKEIENVSKIYQDLKQYWTVGKVRQTIRLRKLNSSQNPISRTRSIRSRTNSNVTN
eukprot:gene10041-10914_t